MLEDVLSDGLQVSDVWDAADVVRRGLDYDVTGREHELVGTHLRNNRSANHDCYSSSLREKQILRNEFDGK